MAIKKVVNKAKTIKVKKCLTFNPNKIYVWKHTDGETLQLYKLPDGKFKWCWHHITHGSILIYDSFEDATMGIIGLPSVKAIYVLNDIKELASVILGEEGFEQLNNQEEEVGNIADDEVHIDDINEDNLYVVLEKSSRIRILSGCKEFNDNYRLVPINTSNSAFGLDWFCTNLTISINTAINEDWITDVYEFSGENVMKEFFEWGLQKIKKNEVSSDIKREER